MMPRNYTETEIKFREEWISFGHNIVDKAAKSLGYTNKQVSEILEKEFDEKYERSHLEVENTQSAEVHKIPADKFFLNAKKKFILNESGTLTWKHKIKLGVIIPIIQNAIKIRQIKKKAKVKMAEIGNSILHAIYSNEEYTLKIVINGLYGLFLYVKSIFYNPSVGSTVTAAGRNVISTSALTVENIGGGYRSYLIEAHLQIISISREEAPELAKKYTLPKGLEVEDVLKHMLKHHYDGYYAKSFLRQSLQELNEDELAVVYLKNNFEAFIKVPEVKALIEKIYKENLKWRETLDEDQQKLEEMIGKIFSRKENPDEEFKTKMGRAYMAGYAKDPIYGPLAKELKKMSGELLMGFYFYSGDYVNGTYCQTSVDIFENMERTKIPTVDTDSNVSSVFDENLILNEVFAEYTKDDEYIYEVGTTVLATIIFTGSIDYSLDRYTRAVGVDPDYSHLIEMEEETTMYDLHLTTGKKKYVFSYFIQDGNFNVDAYKKLKIRGLQAIKSDYNAEICDRVINIFKTRIMVKLDKLDYKALIEDAKQLTSDIMKMIKTDDYIINKSTVKKSNKSSEELAFGDSKNKISRLWKRFGIDGEIDFPGSYKELEVMFTYEALDEISEKYPDILKALKDHVAEIKLFEFYRSVINGSRKFLNGDAKIGLEEVKVIDPLYADLIGKETKAISRLDPDQLVEEYAKIMSRNLFRNDFEKKCIDTFRKCLGLGPKDVVYTDKETGEVIQEITYDDIIENIQKIGLPLDINTVPGFLKVNDYDIIDKEFSATGEFLLGALTDTMGISCPRNTSDKLLISSALQSY